MKWREVMNGRRGVNRVVRGEERRGEERVYFNC
jgi:hypothetical protein